MDKKEVKSEQIALDVGQREVRTIDQKRIRVNVVRGLDAIGLPLPTYRTEKAAGMDLIAALPENNPFSLKPLQRALIPTGLSFEIPTGYEAQVRPRSGLALEYGIGVVNAPGTIDADYRGEVGVLLINFGQEPFTIRRGDRIAQIVFTPVASATLVEVEELETTQRQAQGFGSTGI